MLQNAKVLFLLSVCVMVARKILVLVVRVRVLHRQIFFFFENAMTKLVVFSDIHIPARIKEFPYKKIMPFMQDIDVIFGLGDYNSQKSLDILYGFGKKVFCVKGNMDPANINLTDKLTIKIENVIIGLIHGWGASFNLRKKIKKEFTSVDLICYGHTHSPFWGEENGSFYFNPGAICNLPPSFGILSIDDRLITAKIINI